MATVQARIEEPFKTRRAVLKSKKRHVKSATRLPTKIVWQLLRWTFIVATSIGLQTAPTLSFVALQRANKESYKQFINNCLCVSCGSIGSALRSLVARIVAVQMAIMSEPKLLVLGGACVYLLTHCGAAARAPKR